MNCNDLVYITKKPMDICIVLQWVTAMNIKKQSGYIFQIAFYSYKVFVIINNFRDATISKNNLSLIEIL